MTKLKTYIKVKEQINYLSSINITEIIFNSPINDGLREGYAINENTTELVKYCKKKSISTAFEGLTINSYFKGAYPFFFISKI